jgi:hypothetical protein
MSSSATVQQLQSVVMSSLLPAADRQQQQQKCVPAAAAAGQQEGSQLGGMLIIKKMIVHGLSNVSCAQQLCCHVAILLCGLITAVCCYAVVMQLLCKCDASHDILKNYPRAVHT